MDVGRWFEKAERFRRAAYSELEAGRYDIACFMAQQAAELALKGCLIRLTGSRPYTHLLSELLEILFRVSGERDEGALACARVLEEHHLQARYPNARMKDYLRAEAEEAIRCMEAILGYVGRVLGAGREG